jgi:hypothetical protein
MPPEEYIGAMEDGPQQAGILRSHAPQNNKGELSMQRFAQRFSRLVVLYAWMCWLVPGGWSTVAVHAASPAVQEEQASTPVFVGERFVRTELYFGSLKSDKTQVTQADFNKFLRKEITPRFPEGLTLLTGIGQFRNANNQTIREVSRVLILLYPVELREKKSVLIEEIRSEYKTQHDQESVLRTDRCCERVGF